MTEYIKVGQDEKYTYYREIPSEPSSYKTIIHKTLADLIWWIIDLLIQVDQWFNRRTIQEETKKIETLVFNLSMEEK